MLKNLLRRPKITSETTQSDPKCLQSESKTSQRLPQTFQKDSKKRFKNHPRRLLEKRSTPSCENTIIYYVFERSLFENIIIYYVFVKSEIVIFTQSDENIIIYYVFERSEEPVLAWEREARSKEEILSEKFSKELPNL